ncbi:MAG: polysaccharide deacetylase family protein [Bacillota bacterium]|jgi:peptidoglycan/xylan/chitin deacetylase (PgdA/CDA1 family)|nr:polysaccharide deacetylase family protein [Bacillota bacterium]
MMTDPRLRWPGTGLGTWGSSGFAMLAMALACTVSLAVVAAVPMPVKVCGEWREAFQGATVASVVGREPPAGDLVDVNGEVLELGGGKPGEYLLNGVSCLPDTPVRPGDAVDVRPGDDVIETIIVEEQVLPQLMRVQGSGSFVVVQDWGRATRVAVRRGVITGKQFGEAVTVAGRPMSVKRVQYEPQGKAKKVVLTFDDGPSRAYTPQVLDVLKAEGVRAVFFVLGANAAARPDLVRRMVEEGHEVANHGYSHTVGAALSRDEVEDEVRRTAQVVESITGQATKWFRPPGGALSGGIVEAAEACGHQLVLWNIDPEDWRAAAGGGGVDAIVDEVLSPMPETGSVILFHDGGGDRQATVAAVAEVVKVLKEEGYEFCTLTELAEAAGMAEGAGTAGLAQVALAPGSITNDIDTHGQ